MRKYSVHTTDLKNKTGSSIYIVGKLKPTGVILELPPEEYSGVHREKKNENSYIFYLTLTNEMCSLDVN